MGKRPQATIYTEHGGSYVYETHEEVRALLQSLGGLITLHATTFEGHDHEMTLRRSTVVGVSELTEDRWVFELQSFMDQRAARDAQTQMALKQAEMASAITGRGGV